MSRIRYSEEQKTKALEMIKSDGVAKTSEKLRITKHTLYKWLNASRNSVEVDGLTAEAQALVSEVDNELAAENERLKAENERLAAENAKLIGKITKMRDVINRLLA